MTGFRFGEAVSLDNLYQLIDINLNRAAEGLRILEDSSRYRAGLDEAALIFKEMRRELRLMAEPMMPRLLGSRKAYADPGPQLSTQIMQRADFSHRDAATVNSMRVQEALRALEEYLKALGQPSMAQRCEQMRFDLYTVQQQCFWVTLLKKGRMH